jgi:RHS repeat-associated protein
MTDAAGSEGWSYGDITNQGPVVVDQRTTNSVIKTATYQSNLDGSLASLTYPSGRVITYALASSGSTTASRVASAVDSTGPINYATGALYAPQGALFYVQNGAGFYSTSLFNDRLQPCWTYANTSSSGAPTTCTQTGVSNAAIMDFQYSFGLGTADNGNVSRISNRRTTGRSITYQYDELNRIHDAVTDATSGQFCWGQLFGTQSGSTFTSGYDPWGNFKTITPDPSRPGCSVNTMARTINVYNKIVDTNYVYDADGNLTADPSLTYTYDNENHLSATAGVSYTYDGDGKRVRKSNGKLYWYGTGTDALDETDAAGNTNNSSFNEYVFFGGKRIARRDYSNNVFYYFTDHLGTSREIVQAGQTTPCYDADYYPFGAEAVVATNTCSQNYKFTGKERDSESGLDFFGARYDSSNMGRFMSPDPKILSMRHLVNPQKWNKYAYTINNPLRYFDPDGMEELEIQLRAYIPQQTMVNYRGDNRGPTTSQAVTSRTSVTFRIETDQSKRPPGGYPPLLAPATSKAGETVNAATGNRATQTEGLPGVTSAKYDSKGNAIITIEQNAVNPLSPNGTAAIRSDLTIIVPADGSSITTVGTVSGSPSFELNVFGPGGQATNIPLQKAPDSTFAFGMGLYQTNNISNLTPLPTSPPPCTPGPDKKCIQ